MKKKLLTLAMAAVMVVSTAFSAFAEQITTDTTFTDIVADGTAGWASGATGVTFPVTEDGVTIVFENDGFTRDSFNWSNFIVETIASESAAGFTARADGWGWTYGDNTTNVPTFTVALTWEWLNDAGENQDSYWKSVSDDTTVTLNVKKTDANTVVYDIKFASDAAASEVYTITYPAGVPEDLEFQVGADGGKVTLTSVTFGSTGSDDTTGGDDTTTSTDDTTSSTTTTTTPDTGDYTMVGLLLAVAAVSAVVVLKRRTVAE